jgi:hypothetical protein
VAVGLTACSSSAPTDPATLPDSVAQVLSAEQQRLASRSSNADAELATAEQDWTLYQQGWQNYQDQHPEANSDLLRCPPQPFVGQAKVIGPDGGTLELGTHRLIIPQGALSAPVVITGELTTGPLVAVDFAPHGLTFAKPVLLQVAYTQCGGSASGHGEGTDDEGSKGGHHGRHGKGRHEVVYVGPDEGIVEHLPSTDDDHGNAVSAWLSHFSRYAVYY